MDLPFRIEMPKAGVDKEFCIWGPDGFSLVVDYDDVDHVSQMRYAQRVVDILNAHWETES